jgi:hypothetical protein
MSDRISWNIWRGTATSAIRNVTYLPWLTTFARGFDNAAAMFDDPGINQCAPDRLQRRERAFLCRAHQPRIAHDIGGQDCRQPSLDPIRVHFFSIEREFLSPRAREEQCLPADPARSALARSLRTSDL